MPAWHKEKLLAMGIVVCAGLVTDARVFGQSCRWHFSNADDAGQWEYSGLDARGVSDDLLEMTASRGNPMMFSPRLDIDASARKIVRFRMRLGQGLQSNGALLFVSDAEPRYDDRTLVIFSCRSDGGVHDYEVDMSANPLWRGTIRQVRFQPFYSGWPMPEAHQLVAMHSFSIPGDDELIPNGGLESVDDDGCPTGWTRFCDAPLPIDAGDVEVAGNPANSLVSDAAHRGERCIHTSIPAGRKEIGGWQTRMPIEPGTIYRLSFWARVAGEPHAVASINEYGADGKRTVHHEVGIKSEEWQRYTKEIEAGTNTVGIQIAGIIWRSSGQAWFDDFSLRELDITGEGGPVEIDDSPFSRLTTDVVTPHIAWAVPRAEGPLKLLAIPTHREVVELAQRLSIDYTTWTKFEKGHAGAGGRAGLNDLYHGRRDRGLTASYRELGGKLQDDYDVILIGVQRWGITYRWSALPVTFRRTILERVKAGAGLVYVRPHPDTREALEDRADEELDIPPSVLAGVPFAGLPVLDKDVQGKEWLTCFRYGRGRIAVVEYQNEVFGHWESEKSFRRGSAYPFTPEVTYDYRATPLHYDYCQSFLAKLLIWAGNSEGEVALTALQLTDGVLTATVANAGEPRDVELEIVVRDEDSDREFVTTQRVALKRGEEGLSVAIPRIKAGGHFADLWLRADGAVLAWGSTWFRTEAEVEVTRLTTERHSYRPEETIEGRAVLSGKPAAGTTVTVRLVDSFDRVLLDHVVDADGRTEVPFRASLTGAVTAWHQVQASLRDAHGVVSERSADVVVKAPTVLDDYRFYFWASNANNELSSRHMLPGLYDKGFDVAYIYYLYAQGPDQLAPLLRNTVRANLDLGLFAFNLAAWNAGSDPTLTISPRCLSSPAFRQNMFSVLRQHASLAKAYPVFGYTLGDEAGVTGHGQDFCFSPTCLDHTRTYLRAAYGTINALNQGWGTSFVTWDEVKPMTKAEAKAHGNFAPWVGHRMAMEDMFADLLADSTDVLREVDPDARVGTEGITGGGMYGQGGESSCVGYDFGKIVPQGNFWIVYFQHYPQLEFLRSFAAPDTVLGTYASPFEEAPGGYFEDAWQNEKTVRFVPWYGLFNGMNGTMYWGAMQTSWHGFYSRDFRPTPWGRFVAETIAELKRGIGKLVHHCRRGNSGIAIHYSPASFHVQTIMGGRERMESPKSFCKLIEDLGLQYDFLSREQMAAGKLQTYRALILPYSYAISTGEAAAIRRFVDAGGTVIADGEPGVMDGHGTRVTPGMLAGMRYHAVVNPVWQYARAEVRNGDAGRQIRQEVSRALVTAGVRPPYRIVTPGGEELLGCEIVDFTDGAARYLGVLQGREYIRKQDDDHAPVPVTIELPGPYHVYSVRDAKYIGHTDRVETGIEPAVAKLYALLPCKVDRVTVAGTADSYPRGAVVNYALGVEANPAAELPRVFHVELRRPDGSLCQAYRRSLYGSEGAARGAMPLALNDPAGRWRMTVTDVASGTTAETHFEVR